jgi:hypothetical protein
MNKRAIINVTPEILVKSVLGAVLIILFISIIGKHIIPLILGVGREIDGGEMLVEILIMILILIIYNDVVWILAKIGLID